MLPTAGRPSRSVGPAPTGAALKILAGAFIHDLDGDISPHAVFHSRPKVRRLVRPAGWHADHQHGWHRHVSKHSCRVRPHAKIIVAGSSAEYGRLTIRGSRELASRPLHPYGVSKAATDMLAYQYHKSTAWHTVVARTFQFRTRPRKVGHFPISSAVAWLEHHPGTKCHPRGDLKTKRIVDVRDLTGR